MATATKGNKVQVHYRGYFEDGTEFDSSEGRDPLEFMLGEPDIIAGFQSGVEGMSEGDKVTVTVQPEDGYGPRDPQLVTSLSRDQLPEEMNPAVGMQLQTSDEEGQVTVATIIEIDADEVTIDTNHELAGKVINFDLELVKIG